MLHILLDFFFKVSVRLVYFLTLKLLFTSLRKLSVKQIWNKQQMKLFVGLCSHFLKAHEKTESLKQGQEPKWALSLGTGVCSSNLCFSPWATFFPSWKLSSGANRREDEEGGQFILSATQVLEGLQRLLEGIWMLRTPGLPTTALWCRSGDIKNLREPSSPGTPREPSPQSSSNQLLALGQSPQREFSNARRAFLPAAFN